MAFVIADRVRETTTTTGTGAVTLAGAYISFQSFSTAIGNGNNTYYTIASPTTGEWEVGIGTYTSSTNSLSRDTVLSSSNSGSLVNFAAGSKDVFVTQPSERSLLINSASNGLVAGNATFTSNGVLYANSTTGVTSGSALTWDGTTLAASNISTAGSVTLSGGTANGVLYLNGSKVATSGSALTFNGSALSASGNITSGGVLQALTTVQSSSGADLSLNANGANRDIIYKVNATELMRLVGSTGNLGIGTSSPSYKLSVNTGVAGVLANFTDGVAQTIRLTTGSGFAAIDNPSAGALAFQIAGTERMRLDSSGNLGLGVTPSAWGSNYKAMEFGDSNNQSFIYGQTNADVVSMGTNAYNNNTNYIYKNNGYSTFYLQYNGEHRWSTAASGTAGNAITFTQAMTLDASGNLGIGATSPRAKLELVKSSDSASPSRTPSDYTVLFSAAQTNTYNNGIAVTEGTFVNAAISPIDTGTGGAQGWAFITGNNTSIAEAARIDSSGNLGVGTTTTSSYKLNVGSGGAVLQNNASNISGLFFGTNADITTSYSYIQGDGRSSGYLSFSTNASERARIDSSGNMGLGTTTMTRNFNIGGSGAAVGMNMNNTGTSGRSYSIFSTNSSASAVGALGFYDDTAGAYRMVIDSSGNLLVGTTSSTVWNGSAGTKVVVGGSGNTITSLQSSTTTVDQGAIFEGYATGISSNSAALGSIAFLRSNTSTTALSSYTAFYTNNAGTVAERARITSAGAWSFGSSGTATGTSGQVLTSNGSGSAPSWQDAGGGPVKAWVNFNGTGTVAIRASSNVSSITDNGTGTYTVNFTTAFADANYAPACMVSEDTGSGTRTMVGPYATAPTTTAFRVGTFAGTTLTDMQYVQIVFVR